MRRKHVQYDDMPAAIPNNECDPVNEECNGGACVTSKTLVDKNETEFLVESLKRTILFFLLHLMYLRKVLLESLS